MTDSTKDDVKRRHKHAAKCKKAPADCPLCQDNIRWFGKLSLTDLSDALSENGKTK